MHSCSHIHTNKIINKKSFHKILKKAFFLKRFSLCQRLVYPVVTVNARTSEYSRLPVVLVRFVLWMIVLRKIGGCRLLLMVPIILVVLSTGKLRPRLERLTVVCTLHNRKSKFKKGKTVVQLVPIHKQAYSVMSKS